MWTPSVLAVETPAGPMDAGSGRRRGFSLAEILIAVAIVAVVAAVVIPVTFGRIDQASINRQASTLSTLAQATMSYHDQVGMWPSSLTQLTTAPTTSSTNLCGNTMAAKDVAKWLGPYVSFPITGDISIEGNTITAALARSPSGVATAGVLQIQMIFAGPATSPPTTMTSIQTLLDTDSDPATGVIRWTSNTVGGITTVTMTYNLPITGC